MKNIRYYGKKPPKREKSFITHFFDENAKSDSSLYGRSSDEILQKDSFEETKAKSHTQKDFFEETKTKSRTQKNSFEETNAKSHTQKDSFEKTKEKSHKQKNSFEKSKVQSHTANSLKQSANTLQSPPLFENLSIENLSPELSCIANPIVKTTNAMKKKGKKKKKRFFRKKPVEVFHFSTKYCKKLQPRWSEIYKHDLTIERTGTSMIGRSVTSRMQRNMHKMPLEHISFVNTSPKISRNIIIQKKKIKNLFNDDSLNSSSDLFVSCAKKVKKSVSPFLNISKSKQTGKESYVRKISDIEKKLEQSLDLGSIIISPKHKLQIDENLYNKSSFNCAIPMTVDNETLGSAEICISSMSLSSEKSIIFEKENSQKENSDKRLESPILGDLEIRNVSNLNNSICLSNASDKVKTKPDAYDKENIFSSINLSSSAKENFINPRKTSSKILTPNLSGNSNVLGSNLSNSILKTKFVTSTPINIKFKSLASFNCSEHLHNDELAAVRSSALILKEYPFVPYLDAHAFEIPASISASNKHVSVKSLSNLSLLRSTTLPEKSPVRSYTSKKRSSAIIVSHRNSVDEEEESDESAKTKLLTLCNQNSVVDFASVYDWGKLKIRKIGEGSYGEVFMLTKGRSSSVIKVIPICDEDAADGYQGLQNVLSEVKISKCLSDLRSNKRNNTKNFIKLNSVSLVTGTYPHVLLDAWDNFSQAKSTYNDRPNIFGEKQMFVILELDYGGKDLSDCALRNAAEAESIIKQIAVTLAVAEEEYVFEHRDLHLGNILIKRSTKKTMSYKLRGKEISFECHGVQATIIDFTLSRLHEEGYVYYNDLAQDESLFEQSGDYQFEVYKSMRRAVKNQWETCALYSNVLWLKFCCKKLLKFQYSRPSTAVHKKGLKAIEVFHDQLMNCDSATESLTKCGITAIHFEHSSLELKSAKTSILVSRNSSLAKAK